MPVTGSLRSWNDDRGFGFIAPTGGGSELFVHISAFPRDGTRPTEGESLAYELGRGKDGKPQAVRVYRQALGKQSTYPVSRRSAPTRRRLPFAVLLGIGLVVTIGGYGYTQFQGGAKRLQLKHSPPGTAADQPVASSGQYSCDGRTHCSQMTSCGEAKFFINNCPGTQMDGNNDGVPCEQQWCTSPFSK